MTDTIIHRKTKRGSIMKIIREHYVRDDIPCGLAGCEQCVDIYPIAKPAVYIEKQPRVGLSNRFTRPHVLMPTASALVQQIDIFTDPALGNNLVLLQSVMSEVRQYSITLYARLKELIKHDDRRIYVFSNEFQKDTYKLRTQGETLNQYNERLVKVAAAWYRNHLQSKQIDVIVLDSCPSEELGATTVALYVQELRDNINLLDKVVPDENKLDLTKETFFYPPHIDTDTITGGLKKGRYYQGVFNVSSKNYLEATVSITRGKERVRVLIQGREHMNRAVHEDVVAIELFPESEWTGSSDLVLDPEQEDELDEEGTEKLKNDLKAKADATAKRPTGKVVGIIKRNWRPYVGTLKARNSNLPKNVVVNNHMFVAANRQIPLIKIETRQYDALINQRIIVAIDSWPRNSKFPKGHYVRAMGDMGSDETERECILIERDVPYAKFTPAVLKCLPDPNTWTVPPEEYPIRMDLRQLTICSVDPPGCTDIDDALHARELDNGLYEMGVHIADVSFFVKPGSALDKEASNRASTVYLVDQRIDMIPTVLSSNLCSLVEGQERLTFSVVWQIDPKTAEIKDTKFGKSVIKSSGALTYQEAMNMINQPDRTDEVTQSLRRLNNISKILRKKRMESGALILESGGEVRFMDVESETHEDPTQDVQPPKKKQKTFVKKEKLETMEMIEEFMLLANVSVAKKIYEDYPELALLRKHPATGQVDCEELIQAAKTKGFNMDVSSGKTFSDSLERARDPENPLFNSMLRMIAVRCMHQAEYVCSGVAGGDLDSYRHFGIAAPIYTHFTSPIRRYADLMVHRLLGFSVEASHLDSSLLDKSKIGSIADNCNYRHRNARLASRDSIKHHMIQYIKQSSRLIEETAYIYEVKKNGLNIFVPALAFEAWYKFESEADWLHDADEMSQVYLPSKQKLKRFDKITIQLGLIDRSNEYRRGREEIDTLIVEPPIDKRLNSKP